MLQCQINYPIKISASAGMTTKSEAFLRSVTPANPGSGPGQAPESSSRFFKRKRIPTDDVWTLMDSLVNNVR